MTEQRNLSRFASIANAAYNSITANSTAITAISVGGVSVNSTSYPGTANNATNLGGVAAASYVNTSGSYTLGGDITLNANLTIASTGELIIASGAGIQANGSFGATNQILFSNGSSIFWANSSSAVRQTFTATSGQTTFTVSGGYTPNQVDVYYNGVKLINGTEVTVNGGSNIVLASGAANGATIDVVGVSMTSLTFANAVARTGDTMTGVLNLPSNGLTVGTTQLVVSGGNVGIGTGSPAVRLDVSGNAAVSGSLSSANLTTTTNTATFGTNFYMSAGGNTSIATSNTTSARLRVDTTGGGGYGRDVPNIWLGNSNDPSIRLFNTGNSRSATMYVPGGGGGWVVTCETNAAFDISTDTSGNFTARGNVTAYSDAKLKKDVETIQNALDTVMRLRGVKFRRVDNDDSVNIGFIAQEIQEHVPEVVHSTLEGYLGVSYGNVVALLTEAMKEQQKQIDSLTREIADLKNKLS